MANNKVQLSDGTVIMDVTDTTATASDVASGKYFYGADGVKTQGTASGGGGALIVGISYDEQTEVSSLDKTWQEIYDAVSSGRGAVVVNEYEDDGVAYQETFSVISMFSESGGSQSPYYLYLPNADGGLDMWGTASADGYPVKAS